MTETSAITNASQSVSTDKEMLKSLTPVELWLMKINHQKWEEKEWRQLAEEAGKVYEAGEKDATQFNIFHSNVETLVPALYNSTPVPDVRRRYGDTDVIARLGAEVVERSLTTRLDKFDIDDVMEAMVQNGCVEGRGVPVVHFAGSQRGDGSINYDLWAEIWDPLCFIRGPGKRWEDIPWIAFEDEFNEDDVRREFELSDKEIEELGFGTEASDADLGKKKRDENGEHPQGVYKTITVYKIWDKNTRRVIWISDRKLDEPLGQAEDPYDLPGFFPVPRPFMQIRRSSSLIPNLQYRVYKPLLDELEVISRRIQRLIKQLRVRGIIHPDLDAMAEEIQHADDGKYVAHKNGTAQSMGMRMQEMIEHWPMEPTVVALKQLYEQRESTKAQIYEVTGIADIMRGAVDPKEKLGQSQIKMQSLNLKLRRQQQEVQRVARDIFRIMAHIQIRMVPWEQIVDETRMNFIESAAALHAQAEQSQPGIGHNGGPAMEGMQGIPNIPPGQLNIQDREMYGQRLSLKVKEMLTSRLSQYSIDIETDSTIRSDMAHKQDQMNLFLQGTSMFIQAISAAKQYMPEYVPALMKLYSTTFARQFQFGKEAEDALERMIEVPQSDQEDPRIAEQQQIIQQLQQELQGRKDDLQKHQMTIDKDLKVKDAEINYNRERDTADRQVKNQELLFKLGTEADKEEREERRLQQDEDFKVADIGLRMREADLKDRTSNQPIMQELMKLVHNSHERNADRTEAREERKSAQVIDIAKYDREQATQADVKDELQTLIGNLTEMVKSGRKDLSALKNEVASVNSAIMKSQSDIESGKSTGTG